MTRTFASLNQSIVECTRCPRLIEHCRDVARNKRRAFQNWDYWGRPVPNFGDPDARLLLVGLAPAAHGANRTGRMFTGDRSGDWLFRALHKAGFANQPDATSSEDGLKLCDAAITAVVHCAPPRNKPSREEMQNCRQWLSRSLDLVPAAVLVALGNIAFRAVIAEVRQRNWLPREQRVTKFGHLGEIELQGGRRLISSYHPSQQNTFTGRLTESMLDAVFARVRELLDNECSVKPEFED